MNTSKVSTHPHSSHILPLKTYLSVGGALFILTILTVAVAQVNLGGLNLVIALSIAVIKASLVALFFMHLKYDSRFFSLIFLVAILFLGIFIIFTMLDTLRRGDIYILTTQPIQKEAIIYHRSLSDDDSIAVSNPYKDN